MERAEEEILSQSGISIRLEASTAQERVKVHQPGSPSVLMSASRVAEPSLTIGLLSGKVLVTEASLVQVLSSSSEERSYYSRDEVDFGDEPALLDTSKFFHISEEEMQVYVLAMVPPSGGVTAEGISSILLNYFFVELGRCFNTSFESFLQEWLPVLRLRLPPILRR